MNEIVMISPKFFNIEDSIRDGFISKGYKVTLYDERINNSKLNRILIRTKSKLINRKVNKYFQSIYHHIETHHRDIVMLFIVKAETMPSWFIKRIKENFQHIVTIHYMYDPISNYSEMLEKLLYFDYCFTFDKQDSIEKDWGFRPLFFPNEFRVDVKSEINTDATFIGTLHSDRSEVVKAIESELTKTYKRDDISIYVYYYMPLYLMFFYSKIFQRKHLNVKLREIKTKPLNRLKTAEQLMKSKHVVDVHHLSQTGLTARTFEAIGAKSKIITTNPQVIHYDFYNEKNVIVVDRVNPRITQEWLNEDYVEIDSDIYEYYSANSFVSTFTDLIISVSI